MPTPDQIDRLMDMMEDTIDLHEGPEDPPEEEWDEDDVEDLLYDCRHFLAEVVDRCVLKWQVQGARKLLERIDKGLSWHRLQ